MALPTDIPDGVGFVAVLVVTISGAVWSLAWWLSGQFSSIKNLLYLQINKMEESLLSKLEYHEKHDDVRFDDLKHDLWEMRLHVASNTTNKKIKTL